jgi:adenylate cyclase
MQWGEGPQEINQAFSLMQKAITLDGSLAMAHTMLGNLYLWRDHHYEQAIAEGERALAIDPNCGRCYALYGQTLSYAGRPQEAVGLIEKGMRLDPCCTEFLAYYLAEAYFLMERYEKVPALAKRALSVSPGNLGAHIILAVSYIGLGREEDARAEVAEVLRINPHFALEGLRQMAPNKDRALLERHLAAMRQAGLK